MDSYHTRHSQYSAPGSSWSGGARADETDLLAHDQLLNFPEQDSLYVHPAAQLSPAQHSFDYPASHTSDVDSASFHNRGIDIRPQHNYPSNTSQPNHYNQNPPPWAPPLSISEPGPYAATAPSLATNHANQPYVAANTSSPSPTFYGNGPVSYNGTYLNTNGTDGWSQGDYVADTRTSFALSADLATSPQSFRQQADSLVFRQEINSEGGQGGLPAFDLDDGASTNPDLQAGLPMDCMEGVPSANSQLLAEHQTGGPGPPMARSTDSGTGSGNERAFVGGLFSNSAGQADRSASLLAPPMARSHSATSRMPAQGDLYEGNIAGSLPTTQHEYSRIQPAYEFDQLGQNRWGYTPQATFSPSLPLPALQHGERLRKSARRQSTAASTAADRQKLDAIAEGREAPNMRVQASTRSDSAAQPMQRTSSSKARRDGPLSEESKAGAARTRREKSICLACKLRKTQCDGIIPCRKCETGRQERCCVIAHWMHDIYQDSCASPSQQISSSMDVNPSLPSQVDPRRLLDFIVTVSPTYGLCVNHATGSSYSINLSEVLNLLSSRKEPFELQDIFPPDDPDKAERSAREWLDVITESDPPRSDPQRVWKWGTMPSKATYRLVTTSDCHPDFDITDTHRLCPAAAISRIVLRASELAGFRELQQQCSKFPLQKADPMGMNDFRAIVKHTGKFACLLRLKLAFCRQTQFTNSMGSFQYNRYADSLDKVEGAMKSLYFWHIKLFEEAMKRDKSFRHKRNTLKLHRQVVPDHFPEVATQDGFHAWLSSGVTVLQDAAPAPQPQTLPMTAGTQQDFPNFVYDVSPTWENSMFSSI